MPNPDDFLYEYAVVRYVPRVDREEFVNIGLLMMCKRRKWLRGQILLNPDRISGFDPEVNLEALARQSSLFQRTDVPHQDTPVEEKYRWLTAVKSATLQVSASHPGIIVNSNGEPLEVLNREFDRLLYDLVS